MSEPATIWMQPQCACDVVTGQYVCQEQRPDDCAECGAQSVEYALVPEATQ